MADSLAIAASITHTAAGTNYTASSTGSHTKTITLTGTDVISGIQTIGTAAEEALNAGEVGSTGYILVRSLGTGGNTVLFGATGTGAANKYITLNDGEFAMWRMNAAVFAFAVGGNVTVQYWIYDA